MGTRVGGLKWVVTALAMASVATGVCAAANEAGTGTDTVAAASQQSQQSQQSQDQGPGQDQDQGPGTDNRTFRRGGGGGFDRGAGRGFGRDGGPGSWRPHWRRHWHRWHEGWGRPGWGPRGRGFAGRGPGERFGRPGVRGGPAMGTMRLDAPMLGAFRQLNLSDAQRQRVRTILMSARDSARPQRGNQAGAAAARQDLAAIVNPGDPNYARAVQAAKDRAAQRIQQASQTQQALYGVLTPAQKTQLTQILAQRQARMQQREQRAAGRRAQRGPRTGGAASQGSDPGQPDGQNQPDGGGAQ